MTYGQDCKVIPNVGEYAYIINVKLYDNIMSVKFQIGGKLYRFWYPNILRKIKSK